MKSIYFLPVRVCFAVGFFIAGVGSLHAQNPYLVVPGVKVVAITRRSSEADLKRIYGQKNVRRAEVGIGEGETMPGTVIYPDDSTRTVHIIWKDEQRRRFPQSIHLGGNVWKTAQGIGLGTSLRQLERLNGRAFTLSGFGWDYSGTIDSWKGGKLERALKNDKWTVIRLGIETTPKVTDAELESVMGELEFSSGNRVMRRINPTIYQLIVMFP
ncbi:MAG TPA: hypothetical protein VEQ34_09945 [Pyrinomonadaceae bacterium]|nr:hypothetical protein [Pyrinomonadaceae bacterium]